MNNLFSDCKSDQEKYKFFLSGRGYETGVIACAIQNDVAMAYQRGANFEIELRRLHEVNAELLEALKEICDCPQWVDEATVPKAGIETAPQQVVVNMSVALVRLRKARAAIAKAEGEQA